MVEFQSPNALVIAAEVALTAFVFDALKLKTLDISSFSECPAILTVSFKPALWRSVEVVDR
jgi:heterodisulfide reductase subunit B